MPEQPLVTYFIMTFEKPRGRWRRIADRALSLFGWKVRRRQLARVEHTPGLNPTEAVRDAIEDLDLEVRHLRVATDDEAAAWQKDKPVALDIKELDQAA